MSIPARVSALVLSAVAVSTVALSTTAVAQDWTEQQVVEVALRDGPRARAIRAGTEVTRAEQRARTVLPNPTLAYSREGAGFTEFLQVEQWVPLWGARAALMRAGVAATAAAEADRDAQLWSLRADVRRFVAELLAAQESQRHADAAVADLDALVERLRVREREGEGSRYDRLRAERELAELRRTVADARVQVATARAQLAAILPAGPSLSGIIPPPERARTIPPLDDLLARTRAARPELIALQRDAERLDHEADAARRARLPQPTVIAGVKRADVDTAGRADVPGDVRTDDARTDDVREGRRAWGAVLGLNLTVPLFDTGRREAARWQAERSRVDAEAMVLRQTLETDVRRAVEVLGVRRSAADEYARSLQQETQPLRQIAQTAYAEGELGLLELIDAFRADWNAHGQAVAVRLHARLAEIDLERAVGAAIWP